MVGIKESNPWGIHDLNGNAWEWTMERGDDFSKNIPLIEDGEPNIRFKHGGSYMSEPRARLPFSTTYSCNNARRRPRISLGTKNSRR